MRSILALAVTVAAVALAGCACDTAAGGFVRAAPRAAAPCAAPQVAVAASPCAPASAAVEIPPAYTWTLAAPVGVEFRTGAPEVARAGLQIPGYLVECTGTAVGEFIQVGGRWLRCVGNNLVPEPIPSARYVYSAPPQAPAGPYVRASGPCP